MEKKDDIPLGVCETISLGIKTVLSEIYWVLIKALREWEIKELKKRLEKEYVELGKLTAHDPKNKKSIKLCMDQIDFLKNEIEFLENELKKIRENMLHKRKENWNL